MTTNVGRPVVSRPTLRAAFCGVVDYVTALGRQEQIRNDILQGTATDIVWCLEHPAVVTAGRHASETDRLGTSSAVEGGSPGLVRTTRGGLLTWHGPGQLVVYPILTLRNYRLAGPKPYVAMLCRAVGLALARLGLSAVYDEQHPGVWTVDTPARKLASVGVHIHKGVSIHGIALNLDPDLMEFRKIRPCGLAADVVTSVAHELGKAPTVAQMAPVVVHEVGRLLGADLEWVLEDWAGPYSRESQP